MKHFKTKTILTILLLFLLATQNSFSIAKPIPGIGIVIKKNPGGGAIKIITGSDGSFTTQLLEGEYELSVSQEQLQSAVNGIIKNNYPNSLYRYNGSGIQIVIESEATTYQSTAADGRTYSIVITVPKGGATLTGKMNWDDSVMKKPGLSCPDGYEMSNGECVLLNNSANQQRTEGKTKGKICNPGPKMPSIINQEISCPDGFVMSNGECVPIGSTENENAGVIVKSASIKSEKSSIAKPIPGIGIVIKKNKPAINISVSGNIGSSASDNISNSFSFNPNLGLELIWKNFGFGLDIGTFSSKPHFDFDAYAVPLKNLDFIKITNTKSNWTSTYFLVGPQYSMYLNSGSTKFVLTTSIKGGVTMNAAPNYTITDNSTPPNSIAQYSVPSDYKKNVFTVKPSITFTYRFTENFAANINAQYLLQTGQKEFSTFYTDLSKVEFNLESQKVKSQINAAPKVKTTTKGPDQYISFGLGLTYSFRKYCWNGDCENRKEERGIDKKDIRKGIGFKKDNIPNPSTERATIEKGVTVKGLPGPLKPPYNPTNPDETSTKMTKADSGISSEESEATNASVKKGITMSGIKRNEVGANTDATPTKGWDGSVKGGKTDNIQDLKPPYNPTNPDETSTKMTKADSGISTEESEATNASVKKGITMSGIKRNEVGANTDATPTKGWDGSVKGGQTKISKNFTSVGIVNESGPASQIYGYGGPVVYEACIEFLDSSGIGCDYGASVCFINIVLCGDGGAAISFGRNHLYIPEVTKNKKNQELNVLIISNAKDKIALNGRTLTIKNDIELSGKVAKKLSNNKVYLKAGSYKYNSNNSVEVPIKYKRKTS